jgi:integrase
MTALKAQFLLNDRTTRYVNDLERVVKRSGLGNKPIEKLTLRDFGHYADLNPTTRNRYLSYIKVVLNYAVREELIEKNPLWKWRKPKEQPRKNPLTQEDLDKIKAVAAPHLQWAIEVAQNLGVRCGKTELFSLRWADVNYENNYIKVYARKTKTWRQIPFTRRFGRQLRAMQQQAHTECICEYWSTKHNIARPIERIHKSWRTAIRKAGINYRCVFYDVRHLYATKLLDRGADLLSVSALLGHASTKMTADVYGHASAQGMRRAVSLLEDQEEPGQE